MKSVLPNYNVSEERAQEIYDELQEMEDFPIDLNIEESRKKIFSYLKLIKDNEIKWVEKVIETIYKDFEGYNKISEIGGGMCFN